jgi:hypothetical protein|uniref:Uncharacterized protein n=1 Tax=Oryza rufipogon TaxID=4529 RepID=A0A0E0PXU2_ORYRU
MLCVTATDDINDTLTISFCHVVVQPNFAQSSCYLKLILETGLEMHLAVNYVLC